MRLPGDPREAEAAGSVEARLKFYFEFLDAGYEAAVSGLMNELGCSRQEAVQRLAEDYRRRDREKLEALRRAAVLVSRAG